MVSELFLSGKCFNRNYLLIYHKYTVLYIFTTKHTCTLAPKSRHKTLQALQTQLVSPATYCPSPHSQVTSFLKSNSIYQVHLLWISCKMNYYSVYSILSEIPLSLKLVRVTYICKWTSCISANSQSSISFIEWTIPKLISPFYCWLTGV